MFPNFTFLNEPCQQQLAFCHRCLPNWRNLKEDTPIEDQMSEEDLRAMNSKESAILTSNLSAETLISEQEVITDILQLRTLANLCESLVSDAFNTESINQLKTFSTHSQ